MLNAGRLRILKEVAVRGSVSRAAEALSYTQSAVSQQLAALEAEAGMALLERHPRGVSLTAAGQTLLVHADGVLAGLEAAEAALAEIAGLRAGRLRMASFPTAGATLMPLAIATFRASYPEVELTLAEAEPEELVPRLRAGELDLALVFEFEGQGVIRGRGELTRVELLEDPMHLALPAAHRLAARKRIGLADLREEAWVQTSGASPCARHVVRVCHAAGFEPRVAFESDDYQTVQGLVAAGVGVALIPELALSVVREDIAIRTLSPTPPVRSVLAVAPRGPRLVPAAGAMLRFLGEAADGLSARSAPATRVPAAARARGHATPTATPGVARAHQTDSLRP
jgi:DNA-binding transcriptional LysR family regulator